MTTRLSYSIAYKNLSIPLIWGLAALFYFYENLLQVLPSVIKPQLSQAFELSGNEFGHLTAVCFYAYGLMQIPVGILNDSFKPKYTISLACLLCAMGCFIFAIAKTLIIAKVGRILMGIGGSFAFVSAAKLITHYFSLRWNAFLLGLTVTMGFLGSAVGLSLINQLTEIFDWHSVMQGCALFGIVLSFILYVFIPHPRVFLESPVMLLNGQEKQKIYAIFKQKEIWIIAFYGSLMFIPTQVFGASWGVSFLCEVHGLEQAAAGNHMALIYGGWIVGAPLWGWLSSGYHNSHSIMRFAALVTFVLCVILIFYYPLPSPLIGPLLFGIGLFSSAYLLIFSMIQASTPRKFSGTAFGIVNAMTSLSAFADPLVGSILDRFSSVRASGEYLYTLVDYQMALLIVPFGLLIALFLLFFILSKAYFLKSPVHV